MNETPSGEASQEESTRSEIETEPLQYSTSSGKIGEPFADLSDREADADLTHTYKNSKKDRENSLEKNKSKSLKKMIKTIQSRKDLAFDETLKPLDESSNDPTGSLKRSPNVKKERRGQKKEKKSRKSRDSSVPSELDRSIERSPSSPNALDARHSFSLSTSSKNIIVREERKGSTSKDDSNSDFTRGRDTSGDETDDITDEKRPFESSRSLSEAISLFNTSPKKGIQFLFDCNLIPSTPEELAAFFHQNPDLEKKQISDYISSNNDFAKSTLKQYMRQMDLMNMQFDVALRHLLNIFVLPREAQQIDRVLEAFAYEYYHQNISSPVCAPFEDSECLYVLAYSLVLLNTDAHNPQVKNKMTLDQFLANNRGINKKKDLPQQYLAGLYQRIVKDEMKTSVDQSFPNAIIKGWLIRLETKGKAAKGKTSSPRWCVLNNDHHLYIFKKQKDESQEPVAKFNLTNGVTIELQTEEEAQPADEYSATQCSNSEAIRRGRLNYSGKLSSFSLYETVVPQDCSDNVVQNSWRFSARSSKIIEDWILAIKSNNIAIIVTSPPITLTKYEDDESDLLALHQELQERHSTLSAFHSGLDDLRVSAIVSNARVLGTALQQSADKYRTNSSQLGPVGECLEGASSFLMSLQRLQSNLGLSVSQ
eukprot:TRINITY_DN792_c0_g1_i2.p1 TRINITY_DN792_c0_g1~~TRINITY_DN792_c0_g1_i2.p1  ORF type:complete len:651 (-),score=122.99 TRINITY_DN792_c0_g1_i2:226-2178(-)